MDPLYSEYFELAAPDGPVLAGLLVLLDEDGWPLRAELAVATDASDSEVAEAGELARRLLDERYDLPQGEILPLYVLRVGLQEVVHVTGTASHSSASDRLATLPAAEAVSRTRARGEELSRVAADRLRRGSPGTYLIAAVLILLVCLALFLVAQMVVTVVNALSPAATPVAIAASRTNGQVDRQLAPPPAAEDETSRPAATPTPQPTPVPTPDQLDTYCLWPDDTISEIAINANVTEAAILAVNPDWTGQAGSTIRLPRGSTPPAQWASSLPAVASVADLPFGVSGYYLGRDNRQKRVALSFDVGHVEGNADMMAMLADRGVRATFFVLGGAVENHPEMIAAILENGHELGNHSYTHDNMLGMAAGDVIWELGYTEQLVQAAYPGATTRPIFRAPFGAINDYIVGIANGEGYHVIGWTIDSLDWTDEISADQLYQRVSSLVCPGAIIAMHDVNPANAGALPRLLDFLAINGYELVTVSELLAGSGPR